MINIAVIGLGWWGPKLLRNFMNNPAYNKVYGFDSNNIIFKNRKLEFNFESIGSLDDIRKDNNIDAVAIVTPVQSHYSIAKAAFQSGKHVLVAKPPASTCEEVEELGEFAKKRGLVFMADSTFVYNSAVQKLRDLIINDKILNLRSVQSLRQGDDMRMHHISRIRNTMFANELDVIDDLIFHDLSVISTFLKGNIQILSVHRLHNLHPKYCDTAYIDLKYGDIHVHIGYSWTLPDRKREIVLYSTDKFLVFDDLKQDEKLWLFNIESQKQESIPYEPIEPLQNVVSHFAECVEESKEPVTGVKLMLDVMRVSRQIQNWRD